MRNQVRRDLCRVTINQIDHTSGHTGINEGSDQGCGGSRRFLRGLDHNRATCSQRGSELAHDLIDRKVPGRECCNRTHRLFDHQLVNIMLARRDDAAIGAPSFFSKPVDGVGPGHHLQPCLGQRFALLHGHQAGDSVYPVTQQLRGLTHGLVTLKRAGSAPNFKAPLRGISGLGYIVQVSACQLRQHLAGGRVAHRQTAAGGACAPLAVYVELGVRVIAHIFSWVLNIHQVCKSIRLMHGRKRGAVRLQAPSLHLFHRS